MCATLCKHSMVSSHLLARLTELGISDACQCETSLTVMTHQGMQQFCCLRRLCPRIHRGALPYMLQMAMTQSVEIMSPSACAYTVMLPHATTEQGWWRRQTIRADRMPCWADFSYVLSLVCVNLIGIGLLTLGLMLLKRVEGCNPTRSPLMLCPLCLLAVPCLPSAACSPASAGNSCCLLQLQAAAVCCWLAATGRRCCCLLSRGATFWVLLLSKGKPTLFCRTCLFRCGVCCQALHTIHAGDFFVL